MSRRNADPSLSRRGFLGLGGGLTFFVALEVSGCRSDDAPNPSEGPGPEGGPDADATATPPRKTDPEATGYREANKTAFGAWVRIGEDDSITIFNPAAEMGQGSMTALPVILAEEMDADWDKVRIQNSPLDPEVYGRGWGRSGSGSMLTVGSYAVRGYYDKLRLAGASIRKVLLDLAAKQGSVPVEELGTEPGAVVHAESDRRWSYGQIAAAAEGEIEVPRVKASALKDPANFRLIGHEVERRDIPAKTDGSAVYAIDVKVPGMLYAVMERSPVHGGRVASFNREAVEAMPGIEGIAQLEHGVAVAGTSMSAVLAAKDQLEVEWKTDPKAAAFDSEAALADFPQVIDQKRVAAKSVNSQGKGRRALARAAKRLSADYFADFAYHAQIEPLNAVVSVTDQGAELWVGTQGPGGVQRSVAEALGIPRAKVIVHRCYLGGGFGRRSRRDYVVEAAQISKALGRPVKLVWTREDDIHYGMFRPMNLQRMEAGLDASGKLESWGHCVVGSGDSLLTSGIQIPLYADAIAHHAIELRNLDTNIRMAHLRSVGHHFNKFAIEAFVDEIAAAAGKDPVDFRRELLGKSARAKAVLEKVVAMSDWSAPPKKGRAKGIAIAERSGSVTAAVAEVSANAKDGIRIHRYWCAVDCGTVVQPGGARAQVEGGIVMGLSMALEERVTFKNGRVVQSNYHNYRILRMADMPEIEVAFMPSTAPPEGIGEASIPPTAAAVANAFAALTGKRLRHMPFTPERVAAALT